MATTTNKNILISQIRQGLLRRPRIERLLAKATAAPLVTVTAGAGYGKTQAVSMFLNHIDTRKAWIQLTDMDNTEESFWKKFISVMSFTDKNEGENLQQRGFPTVSSEFEHFIHVFAKEIYAGNHFILVFDDFHLVSNEAITNFIRNLIHSQVENLCIVMISRTKIELKIPGLVTGGRLWQIEMDDLRFTSNETWEYLKMQGLQISQKNFERIQTMTGGWPFALYLVSLSIKNGVQVSENPIDGALPMIFNLIEEEIFSLYPPDIQNIFIKISLLKTFPAALIKKLSGSKFTAVLSTIRTNMFVQYDPCTENYHFHQLFLEFLSKKQIYLKEDETNQIYSLAADWYLECNQKTDAISCYKRCGDYDKIWNTIFNMKPERRPKKITDFLISALDTLPKEFIQRNPMVRVMRASFLLNNLELAAAMEDLFKLIDEMSISPQTQQNKEVIGEAYIILAFIHLTIRDYSFIEDIKKAEEYLPNGSIFNYEKIKIIDSNDSIIPHSPQKNDIEAMLAALFEGAPRISKVTHGLAEGAEFLAEAEVSYYEGNYRKAEESAYQAIYKAKKMHQTDIECCSYFLLMRLSLAKGNYPALLDSLRELRQYAEESGEFVGILDIAQSWFYIKMGKSNKTVRWILSDTLNNEVQSPISIGRDKFIKAFCLLEEGKYYELLAFSSQLESLYYEKGLFFGFTFLTILKLIALYEIGEQEQWIHAFEIAYDISQKSGYIIQFVEMGNHVRKIIDKIRTLKNHSIPKKWLDDIYAKASTYAKHHAYLKGEYQKENPSKNTNNVSLTKREKEVLESLCHGLTREEIAASLYISVGTVKNTLNNVYSKIGALNSSDAVRIAVQMQIV